MILQKHNTILLLLYLFSISFNTAAQFPYKNASLPVDERVKDLLSRMTAEEKFWQLFMIPGDIDEGKEKYKYGIFGLQISSKGNNDAQKINALQKFFVEETRLGIPIIPFEEALHGLVRKNATVFPQAIALAATWDTSLMHSIALAIADEAKRRGFRQILSPVVNIAADPRWGRTEETYGEDPFLSSAMGIAFVSAFEKSGIITTPKHFLVNSGDGGRDSYPVDIDERLLEEIYLPPFRACIEKGGSRSIMTSYNSLNGSPNSANDWLLNKKLKQEMHFTGFVISDAAAVGGANVLHFTAKDYPQSCANAINNGLDVIFQTAVEHYKLFIPPFLDGRIDMKKIDEAVTRVLKIKFELGLFEHPYVNEESNSADNSSMAKESAAQSIVLLKNEKNILPLHTSIRSIAIIGIDATEARLGGYSGPGENKVNILDGIKHKLGSNTSVIYSPGCGRSSPEWVIVPSTTLSTTANGKKEKGLSAQYFNNIQLSGKPVVSRTDAAIDFRWTLYPPHPDLNADFYSAKWTGKIQSPVTGKYKIGIDGNDGFRLYLDGKLVIDNWKSRGYSTILTNYYFEKGKEYDIRIDFFESSGPAWFRLIWNVGVPNDWKKKINEAVAAGKKSDVAIVVAGIEEGEGRDRAFLNLPGHQEEMIRSIAGTGKPVVVVLIGGSAITMSSWINDADAILDAWYPGGQGGNALADVLFGDHDPGGRLPVSFPVTEGQLPFTYNHKPTGRNDDYEDLNGQPLFPFGYGLSYTNFEYSDLQIDKSVVRCKIKNTGTCSGDEVVQLYIHDVIASVARPVKELKGFQKIHLRAGEQKEISFAITTDMLKMLNDKMQWVVEPGGFRIMIGASSRDIRLRGIYTVE